MGELHRQFLLYRFLIAGISMSQFVVWVVTMHEVLLWGSILTAIIGLYLVDEKEVNNG